MSFILNGKLYSLAKDEVRESLQGVEPRGRSKYFVSIAGKRYPIKQIVSIATGLPVIMFTSADACRILSRLGFEIESEESNIYHEALAVS